MGAIREGEDGSHFYNLNPFMPNVFYMLINWTSQFRILFLFKFEKKLLYANSGEPDQRPHFVASDLLLNSLPMSHKKDARLI